MLLVSAILGMRAPRPKHSYAHPLFPKEHILPRLFMYIYTDTTSARWVRQAVVISPCGNLPPPAALCLWPMTGWIWDEYLTGFSCCNAASLLPCVSSLACSLLTGKRCHHCCCRNCWLHCWLTYQSWRVRNPEKDYIYGVYMYICKVTTWVGTSRCGSCCKTTYPDKVHRGILAMARTPEKWQVMMFRKLKHKMACYLLLR